MEATTSSTTVDGATVAFTVAGQGPALLLLHGAGASKDINWDFLNQQREHFTVIAPDLPGSGGTLDEGGPLQYDALLAQASGVVTAAGHERFHVLGYSLGAHLALALAAAAPSRVLSVTAIAGWARPDPYMQLEFQLWQELHAASPGTFARFAVLTGSHPDWLATSDADEVQGLVGTFASILAPGTARQAEFITRTDLMEHLGRVTAPTLLVELTADRQVPPAHTQALHDAVPGARLATLDAGHIAPWQAPAALADAVTPFLTALLPTHSA